jgi:hypothetical protein
MCMAARITGPAEGFCNYPQYNIPGVAAEGGRCDTPDSDGACNKGTEWLYGVEGGGTVEVWCAGEHHGKDVSHGVEVWKCVGDDKWELEGAAVNCGASKQSPHSPAGFCNYPQYTIPGVGDEDRCDTPDSDGMCTKETEETYGAGSGDVVQVWCAGDDHGEHDGIETWKCVGDDAWELQGEALKCPLGFCNYPQYTIPGVAAEGGRCDTPNSDGRCNKGTEWLYGTMGGGTAEVWCSGDHQGKAHGLEVWKCMGHDKWALQGEAIHCPA